MSQTAIQSRNDDFTNQNIYITSDEKIKEGDWHLSFLRDKFEVINYLPNGGYRKECLGKEVCKIILTTDFRLSPDVQKIDDEFVEWFVNNPSCEVIQVEKSFHWDNGVYEYEIIIPKEEPKKVLTEEDIFNQKDIDAVTDYINKEQQKQALIDMMKSDEELGLYEDTEINRIELVCKDCSDSLEDCTCIKSTIDFPRQEIKLEEVFNDDKKENIKKFIDEIKNPSEPNQALKDAAQRYEKYSERFDNKDNEIVEGIFNPDNWGRRLVKEKPKQETLEEAALLAYPIHLIWDEEERYDCSQELREAFIEGAKWQQERSYSEEEVIAFGEFIFKHSLLTHAKGVKNLFEQFKNK
jgi:hypothetical protein